MKHQDFNHAWLFEYAAQEDWQRRAARGAGTTVNLPHDFRIGLTPAADTLGGSGEGYYPGGYGYYEKSFELDEAAFAGETYLYFDGVYRLSEVRLNNRLLCSHAGGYSPFYVDLKPALKKGKNTLFVRVNGALLPGSRWYPGAGIYRGVELLTAAGPAHLLPDSLWLDTLSLTGDAAHIALNARASSAVKSVRFTLLDGETAVLCATAENANGLARAEAELADARLWSADTPFLYTLKAEALDENGQAVDAESVQSGVRTVSVSAQTGLLINGRPVLLKGGCVHHDCGLLGSASHRGAEYRKARLLKESGYNAVRCAHNPPSASFLKACDSLGLYVIDEAFDAWREGKRAMDGHLYFESVWQSEIAAMVGRDRHHASVIFWSTGNEVPERSGVSDGAAWSHRLAAEVRRLDETRPVMNAVCGFFEETELKEMEANALSTVADGKDYWAQKSEDFLSALDVCGYNYLLDRYEKDHALFPQRVFVGSESFPLQALKNWQAVEKLPYLIGDFVWTALDYLGEAGIGRSGFAGPVDTAYPWRAANCGDLDILGGKRPQSHYRDFIWTDRTAPYLCAQHPSHFGKEEWISAWGWQDLIESWTFPGFEGKDVSVTAYARGARAVLYLNGDKVGESAIEEYKASFVLPYAPGRLEVYALDETGKEIGRASLQTARAPAGLCLHAEEKNMPGTKLRYVWIELRDENGVLCPNAQEPIQVQTQGCRLLALGSADPRTMDNFTQSACHLHAGKALAILRRESAHPSVTVKAQGLPDATLLI